MRIIDIKIGVNKLLNGELLEAESWFEKQRFKLEEKILLDGYVLLKSIIEIPASKVHEIHLAILRLFCTPFPITLSGQYLQDVMDRKVVNDSNYATNNIGFQFHTDGVYLKNPPEYVIMGCVKKAFKGGDSVVINGHQIVEGLKEKPTYFEILTNQEFYVYSTWDKEIPEILSKKIIELNPDNTLSKVSYFRGNVVRGHTKSNNPLSKIEFEALNYFDMLCLKQLHSNKYILETGDFVMVDNHKMLHGRLSFDDDVTGSRHLTRMWGNKKN